VSGFGHDPLEFDFGILGERNEPYTLQTCQPEAVQEKPKELPKTALCYVCGAIPDQPGLVWHFNCKRVVIRACFRCGYKQKALG
jgi:hypothetical protein